MINNDYNPIVSKGLEELTRADGKIMYKPFVDYLINPLNKLPVRYYIYAGFGYGPIYFLAKTGWWTTDDKLLAIGKLDGCIRDKTAELQRTADSVIVKKKIIIL